MIAPHSTSADIKASRQQPHPRPLTAIRAALGGATAAFIEDDGRPDLRLRKPSGHQN